MNTPDNSEDTPSLDEEGTTSESAPIITDDPNYLYDLYQGSDSESTGESEGQEQRATQEQRSQGKNTGLSNGLISQNQTMAILRQLPNPVSENGDPTAEGGDGDGNGGGDDAGGDGDDGGELVPEGDEPEGIPNIPDDL